MFCIQANVPDLMINEIMDDDVIAFLEHLHSGAGQHKWHAVWPTLISWIVKAEMGQRLFAVFFHNGSRFGLQNRIVIVPDKLQLVAAAITARQVDKRGRS